MVAQFLVVGESVIRRRRSSRVTTELNSCKPVEKWQVCMATIESWVNPFKSRNTDATCQHCIGSETTAEKKGTSNAVVSLSEPSVLNWFKAFKCSYLASS